MGRTFWDRFLMARKPCHPTNSVKALKGTQSNDPNMEISLTALILFEQLQDNSGRGRFSLYTRSLTPVIYLQVIPKI